MTYPPTISSDYTDSKSVPSFPQTVLHRCGVKKLSRHQTVSLLNIKLGEVAKTSGVEVSVDSINLPGALSNEIPR